MKKPYLCYALLPFILHAFLVFLLLSCTSEGGAEKTTSPGELKTEGADVQPGEVLVKFREGTDIKAIEAIQNKMKLVTIEIISKPNLYRMKIQDGSSINQVLEQLKEYNEVEYSEPNYIYSYD